MISLPPPEAFPAPEPQEPSEQQQAIQAAEAAATQQAREQLDWPTSGPGSINAFNSVEIADQLDAIQEWLTLGFRPNEIRRLSRERWGLSAQVADRRIQDARSRIIRDINVLDRPAKVAQMVEQLEQVLKMSIDTKQGSNAIGALRLQADLLQLLARHQ